MCRRLGWKCALSIVLASLSSCCANAHSHSQADVSPAYSSVESFRGFASEYAVLPRTYRYTLRSSDDDSSVATPAYPLACTSQQGGDHSGHCAEVWCDHGAAACRSSEPQIVYIVAVCPASLDADLGLALHVAEQIAGSSHTRIPIRWRYVDCARRPGTERRRRGLRGDVSSSSDGSLSIGKPISQTKSADGSVAIGDAINIRNDLGLPNGSSSFDRSDVVGDEDNSSSSSSVMSGSGSNNGSESSHQDEITSNSSSGSGINDASNDSDSSSLGDTSSRNSSGSDSEPVPTASAIEAPVMNMTTQPSTATPTPPSDVTQSTTAPLSIGSAQKVETTDSSYTEDAIASWTSGSSSSESSQRTDSTTMPGSSSQSTSPPLETTSASQSSAPTALTITDVVSLSPTPAIETPQPSLNPPAPQPATPTAAPTHPAISGTPKTTAPASSSASSASVAGYSSLTAVTTATATVMATATAPVTSSPTPSETQTSASAPTAGSFIETLAPTPTQTSSSPTIPSTAPPSTSSTGTDISSTSFMNGANTPETARTPGTDDRNEDDGANAEKDGSSAGTPLPSSAGRTSSPSVDQSQYQPETNGGSDKAAVADGSSDSSGNHGPSTDSGSSDASSGSSGVIGTLLFYGAIVLGVVGLVGAVFAYRAKHQRDHRTEWQRYQSTMSARATSLPPPTTTLDVPEATPLADPNASGFYERQHGHVAAIL